MGYLQSSSNSANSHLYSQALQMKLYQAFIFAIPILFSIILFLLFYLFYLKRTFSNNNSSSSTSTLHPAGSSSSNHDSSTLPHHSETGLKLNLEDKLTVILFDEDLYAEDSMCCVCLGEFEMNEKLHQIPACQHMFHGDCIRNWLHSNITCPLCRCSVINDTAAKDGHHEPQVVDEPAATVSSQSMNSQLGIPLEHSIVIFEGSSSSSSMDKLPDPANEESHHVVNIQIHDS